MASKAVAQKVKQRPIVIRDSVFTGAQPEPPNPALLNAVCEVAKACAANAEALRAVAATLVPSAQAPLISIH